MPSFLHEQELITLHGGHVAGVDEVGYGAWAGPVLVCAVVLEIDQISQELLNRLDDSKKLTKKHREEIYELLTVSPGVTFEIAQSSAEEIDRSNVLIATHQAMKKAISQLKIPIKSVLVDGKNKPKLELPCHALIEGDSKSYSIAAASIIAKVTRDKLMGELHQQFSCYGWDTNVGYGTKVHRTGLLHYGVTPFHRLSYKIH